MYARYTHKIENKIQNFKETKKSMNPKPTVLLQRKGFADIQLWFHCKNLFFFKSLQFLFQMHHKIACGNATVFETSVHQSTELLPTITQREIEVLHIHYHFPMHSGSQPTPEPTYSTPLWLGKYFLSWETN